MSGWCEADSGIRALIPTRYFVPVSKYEWESGSNDHSLDSSLSIYLPAKELVENLGLRNSIGEFGAWRNENEVVFLDPSIKLYGQSYALMNTQKLSEWLDKNGLEIHWLVSGEKQLFSSD